MVVGEGEEVLRLLLQEVVSIGFCVTEAVALLPHALLVLDVVDVPRLSFLVVAG